MNINRTGFVSCFQYDAVVHDEEEPLISNSDELCGTPDAHRVWEIVFRIEEEYPWVDKNNLLTKSKRYDKIVDEALYEQIMKPRGWTWKDPLARPWFRSFVGKKYLRILEKKCPVHRDVNRLAARVENIRSMICRIGVRQYALNLFRVEKARVSPVIMERYLNGGKAMIYLYSYLEHLKQRRSSYQANYADLSSCSPQSVRLGSIP